MDAGGGVEHRGAAEFGHGVIYQAQVHKLHSEIGVRFCIIGVEPYCLLKCICASRRIAGRIEFQSALKRFESLSRRRVAQPPHRDRRLAGNSGRFHSRSQVEFVARLIHIVLILEPS
jgi:hypothetical protein